MGCLCICVYACFLQIPKVTVCFVFQLIVCILVLFVHTYHHKLYDKVGTSTLTMTSLWDWCEEWGVARKKNKLRKN